MEYKLFDDYISLQAFLKEVGLIHTGGAAKAFLQEETVLLNGEIERRRGKKLYLGDSLSLSDQKLEYNLVAPNEQELAQHQAELEEKQRVAKLVKEMNKDKKMRDKKNKEQPRSRRKPVRFPGN